MDFWSRFLRAETTTDLEMLQHASRGWTLPFQARPWMPQGGGCPDGFLWWLLSLPPKKVDAWRNSILMGDFDMILSHFERDRWRIHLILC